MTAQPTREIKARYLTTKHRIVLDVEETISTIERVGEVVTVHLADGTHVDYDPEEGVTVVDATCVRCRTTAAAPGVCCSSHGKQLCHLCYRRTHFVELCVADCKDCAAENLPVNLRDLGSAR